MPFDNQVQGANETAKAPVLRRSLMSSSQNGTAAFMNEMRNKIVYDHTRTDLSPSINQAINELVSTMGNHKNNTIILLTDGDPTDPLEEEIQFQKIVYQYKLYRKLQQSNFLKIDYTSFGLCLLCSTNNFEFVNLHH